MPVCLPGDWGPQASMSFSWFSQHPKNRSVYDGHPCGDVYFRPQLSSHGLFQAENISGDRLRPDHCRCRDSCIARAFCVLEAPD